MSDSEPVETGAAREDTIPAEIEHDTVASAIWAAMERAIAAMVERNYAAVIIPQLLRSMRETHDSMRAIYTAAAKTESTKKEATGRWADLLILTRAQLDAVFVGVLLAHDDAWGPKYYKACWATEAKSHFFSMQHYPNSPLGRRIRNTNVHKLKLRARQCQVTPKEWVATLAEVRGPRYRRGVTGKDRIKSFPTPGQVVSAGLLAGGAYSTIVGLLYQHWKFLCDPSHAGLSVVTLRHALRSEQFGKVGEAVRETAIYQEVAGRSFVPSFVAIMTLVTILAIHHKDNVDMMAAVTTAWGTLATGTLEGSTVWNGWARAALGALG